MALVLFVERPLSKQGPISRQCNDVLMLGYNMQMQIGRQGADALFVPMAKQPCKKWDGMRIGALRNNARMRKNRYRI